MFGAVLDAGSRGRFRIRPTGEFHSTRRYLTDTNILETTFRTDAGVVAVRDLMPVATEAEKRSVLTPDHQVLREVEGLAGAQLRPSDTVVGDPCPLDLRGDPGRVLSAA